MFLYYGPEIFKDIAGERMDAALLQTAFVITSYSIHYTKLYDTTGMPLSMVS